MSKETLRNWVKENAEGLMPEIHFTDEDIDHISMCMWNILEWYYHDLPLGHFLTAVVKNDFAEACIRADIPNRKGLYLYALFLYNKMPFDWRDKLKSKRQDS